MYDFITKVKLMHRSCLQDKKFEIAARNLYGFLKYANNDISDSCRIYLVPDVSDHAISKKNTKKYNWDNLQIEFCKKLNSTNQFLTVIWLKCHDNVKPMNMNESQKLIYIIRRTIKRFILISCSENIESMTPEMLKDITQILDLLKNDNTIENNLINMVNKIRFMDKEEPYSKKLCDDLLQVVPETIKNAAKMKFVTNSLKLLNSNKKLLMDKAIEELGALLNQAEECIKEMECDNEEQQKFKSLRTAIRDAITDYIKESFTVDHLIKHDGAASINRIYDMYDSLKMIINSKDAEQLAHQVSGKITSMKRTFFGSRLQTNLKQAIVKIVDDDKLKIEKPTQPAKQKFSLTIFNITVTDKREHNALYEKLNRIDNSQKQLINQQNDSIDTLKLNFLRKMLIQKIKIYTEKNNFIISTNRMNDINQILDCIDPKNNKYVVDFEELKQQIESTLSNMKRTFFSDLKSLLNDALIAVQMSARGYELRKNKN